MAEVVKPESEKWVWWSPAIRDTMTEVLRRFRKILSYGLDPLQYLELVCSPWGFLGYPVMHACFREYARIAAHYGPVSPPACGTIVYGPGRGLRYDAICALPSRVDPYVRVPVSPYTWEMSQWSWEKKDHRLSRDALFYWLCTGKIFLLKNYYNYAMQPVYEHPVVLEVVQDWKSAVEVLRKNAVRCIVDGLWGAEGNLLSWAESILCEVYGSLPVSSWTNVGGYLERLSLYIATPVQFLVWMRLRGMKRRDYAWAAREAFGAIREVLGKDTFLEAWRWLVPRIREVYPSIKPERREEAQRTLDMWVRRGRSER